MTSYSGRPSLPVAVTSILSGWGMEAGSQAGGFFPFRFFLNLSFLILGRGIHDMVLSGIFNVLSSVLPYSVPKFILLFNVISNTPLKQCTLSTAIIFLQKFAGLVLVLELTISYFHSVSAWNKLSKCQILVNVLYIFPL